MTIIKVEGIVLRTSLFKENSRMVTLFTPDKGKITCMAHNSPKLQSSNATTFQVGNHVEALLYQKLEGSAFSTVTQSKIINQFRKTKENLPKLALSQYAVEVINKNTESNEVNYPLYQILFSAIHYIEKNPVNMNWKTTFDYFLLVRLGFKPEINRCVLSGVPLSEGVFDVREGGLTDKKLKRKGYFFGKAELDYLQILISKTPFSPEVNVPKNVRLAIDQMISEHAYGPFLTLKYYGMS